MSLEGGELGAAETRGGLTTEEQPPLGQASERGLEVGQLLLARIVDAQRERKLDLAIDHFRIILSLLCRGSGSSIDPDMVTDPGGRRAQCRAGADIELGGPQTFSAAPIVRCFGTQQSAHGTCAAGHLAAAVGGGLDLSCQSPQVGPQDARQGAAGQFDSPLVVAK